MITCFYCFIPTHFLQRQLFFQLFAQLFYFPLSVTTLHRLVSPHVISLTTSRWLLSTITRIRSLSSTTTFRFPFIGMFLSSPCLIFCPNFSLRFIRTISVWYSSMFYLFYLILLLASVATLESSSHIVKLRSSQLVGVRWLMSWTTRSSTLIVLPWFASTLRTLLFLATWVFDYIWKISWFGLQWWVTLSLSNDSLLCNRYPIFRGCYSNLKLVTKSQCFVIIMFLLFIHRTLSRTTCQGSMCSICSVSQMLSS